MNEMFSNIKMLKLYGWESWFSKRIAEKRLEETKLQRRSIERYIIFDTFGSVARNMIPVITYSIFIGMGNTLDLAMVIVA